MHRTTQRSQPPGGTTRKQNPAASSYPRDNNGQTHRRTWAPNKETQPQKAERPLAATLPQGNRPHPKPPHNRQTYNERPPGSRKVPTSTARRERGGPPRRGHERTGEGKEQGTDVQTNESTPPKHKQTRKRDGEGSNTQPTPHTGNLQASFSSSLCAKDLRRR